jgi:hypothetical protein
VRTWGSRSKTKERVKNFARTLTDLFLQPPLYPVYAIGLASKSHRLGRSHTIDVGGLAQERC